MYRDRILGRDWDKSLNSFPPCFSQSPLLQISPPSPPPAPEQGLKLVCNVSIVYGNLKSENSKDYAKKPYKNCTFKNPASVAVATCARARCSVHGVPCPDVWAPDLITED